MAKAKRYAPAPEHVAIFCPACNTIHSVIEGRWGFNGDYERPTFTPSLLVRSGHYVDGKRPCWCDYRRENPDAPTHAKCYQCHSFIRDGRIEYLGDCSHELAGQTVDLPDFPEDYDGYTTEDRR